MGKRSQRALVVGAIILFRPGSPIKYNWMASALQVRVLVVDDEQSQRTLLAEMISAWGFAVVTAADGEEALEKHLARAADVIVTDLLMPRMDGFDLLRKLESIGDRTPVIVLTAVGGIPQGISV